MARSSLPPGFRFHPTDVELVMYYLKRKVLKKKLLFEAIAEVNIYKHSPWDLPDKSSLKSKDLEWFFFCPRERKYATGARVKRATETGYWKTTGKDRHITYNSKSVGAVRTLVFHLGQAPKGERTDWVIHEYKILDEQLAAAGVQDSYVLCKLFKKNGLGPKNGAQYGAPFNEAEWTDDDDDDVDVAENNSATPFTPNSFCLNSDLLSGKQMSVFDPGSTSAVSTIEEGPLPSTTTEMVPYDPDDEILRLLASFTNENTLLSNVNENHKEGDDTFDGLEDLHRDGTPLNMFHQDNLEYLELNDLVSPMMTGSAEFFRTDDLPDFGYK